MMGTELRRQLHWLPVHQRINYNLALLTYKTRSVGNAVYLASLQVSHKPTRTLRSSNTYCTLVVVSLVSESILCQRTCCMELLAQ